MDKSMFDKYISEMLNMQAAATPTVNIIPTENSENMSGSGKLIVNVTSVRGLYPVVGAHITVLTGDEANPKAIAEGNTDKSGKSPVFVLPAPDENLSEAPNPPERPYAYYNIKTTADGFTENINYNVQIFDNVTSLQNVNLIPLAVSPLPNTPIIIDEYGDYPL